MNLIKVNNYIDIRLSLCNYLLHLLQIRAGIPFSGLPLIKHLGAAFFFQEGIHPQASIELIKVPLQHCCQSVGYLVGIYQERAADPGIRCLSHSPDGSKYLASCYKSRQITVQLGEPVPQSQPQILALLRIITPRRSAWTIRERIYFEGFRKTAVVRYYIQGHIRQSPSDSLGISDKLEIPEAASCHPWQPHSPRSYNSTGFPPGDHLQSGMFWCYLPQRPC